MDGETKNSSIDLSYLELTFNGNAKVIKKILQSFLKNAPNNLLELEALEKAKQWNDVKEVAHKLKTSFNTVGSKKTGSLLESIELGATSEDISVSNMIDEVKQLGGLVFKEIELKLSTNYGE